MLILWGARTCAFHSKNCSHYSKRVISSLSYHKVIVYHCRERRVFRSLNATPTFAVSDDSMTFSVEGRVVGVLSTSMYIACNKCNKKIQNDDNSSDLITCNYCNMQQMADLCPTQYYAQLLFLTTTKKDKLTLTVFNKVISQLFSTEGVFNPSKNDFVKVLLGLKDVVVTYNKRSKVVTNILRPHI